MARAKKIFGFTLVELMASIVVVMVLVALALPRYRLFIASSRQAEAQANLGIIATLQQSYALKYGGGGNYLGGPPDNLDMGGVGKCDITANQANLLGFRVVDCSRLRYNYTTHGAPNGGGSATNNSTLFSGKPIYPGCSGTGADDVWNINEQRLLQNTAKVIEKCHK